MAIERGEVDGVCGAWSTLKADKPDWLREGKIVPLLQVSFSGIPELKGVPTLSDFKMSDKERELLEFFASPDVIGRPYLGPPGIPADRLAALREAFDATMRDPDFQADAKKTNLEIDPVSGSEMESRLKTIYTTPADVLQHIIALRHPAN